MKALIILFCLFIYLGCDKSNQKNEIQIVKGKIEIGFRDTTSEKIINKWINEQNLEVEKLQVHNLGFYVRFKEKDPVKLKTMLDSSVYISDYNDMVGRLGNVNEELKAFNEKYEKKRKELGLEEPQLDIEIYFKDHIDEVYARIICKELGVDKIHQVTPPAKFATVLVPKDEELEWISKIQKSKIVEFAAVISENNQVLEVTK